MAEKKTAALAIKPVAFTVCVADSNISDEPFIVRDERVDYGNGWVSIGRRDYDSVAIHITELEAALAAAKQIVGGN